MYLIARFVLVVQLGVTTVRKCVKECTVEGLLFGEDGGEGIQKVSPQLKQKQVQAKGFLHVGALYLDGNIVSSVPITRHDSVFITEMRVSFCLSFTASIIIT